MEVIDYVEQVDPILNENLDLFEESAEEDENEDCF